MVCTLSCTLAIAFVSASVFLGFTIDKDGTIHQLERTLPAHLRQRYTELGNERRGIYFTGFSLGLAASLLLILMNMKQRSGKQMGLIGMSCTTAATTLGITYLYYILAKKSDYIVKYLHTQEQRDAWVAVYREMQYKYHLIFALGLAGATLLPRSICC